MSSTIRSNFIKSSAASDDTLPEYKPQAPPSYVRPSDSSSSLISDQELDIENPPKRLLKINYRRVVQTVGTIVLEVVQENIDWY